MRLCRYSHDGAVRLGRIDGDTVTDITRAGDGTDSMRALLMKHTKSLVPLAYIQGASVPLQAVTLLAPINDPQKFMAIGMNYQKHAEEAVAMGHKVPEFQLWFNKQVSCINDPYAPIELPKVSDKMDYEAELALIIGKRCRHVSEENALSVVAGYMVCNDVSVRDWQRRTPTFTLGKSFDTHGPLGPWLMTPDELGDPQNVMMHLTVNGEERQRTSTSDMIYNIRQQISYLSTVMTLEPGDVIATGTPSGVGSASGTFLKEGDVVRIEVDGLGYIENEVVAEVA